MFPLTVNTSKTLLSSSFLTHHHHPPIPHTLHLHSSLSKPISATITSSSSSSSQNPPPQQQHYQPFRPPPSPLPTKFSSLDTNGRLEILANRLGLWFEYALIIPTLTQEGFSPSTIEEITGISGVEQNRIIVAAKVRDTLIHSNTDPDTLSYFDNGGAEILYEIRLLSTTQRAAAVRFAVDNRLDGNGARELARSVKDFPRRRGDRGWTNFDYNLPEDCLSFMYYRQAQEHRNLSEQRTAALKQALEVAGSEAAKKWILEELEGGDRKSEEAVDDDGVTGVRVPVVRMKIGEVAESTTVVVLPVCKAAEAVVDAPWECGTEGEFGVVVAEKGWKRWVVLPGWEPIAGLRRGGVAMAFPNARVLPWKANRSYKEEPILVVADRTRNQVTANDGFYLVECNDDGGGLKVERGSALKEKGVTESLGTVLLVVRPPREGFDDQQLGDEDWE